MCQPTTFSVSQLISIYLPVTYITYSAINHFPSTFSLLTDRILSKLGYINCMTVTLLLNASRLYAYSILSHPIWALFIAVLDGITFGVGYATITSFANLISTPETKTVIQATFNSIFDGLGRYLR